MLQIRDFLQIAVPDSSIYSKLTTDESPVMDYEILGGKKEMLANINAKPIYWEVFGFALTPSVLQSVLVGSITTVAGSVISYLSTLLT
jgi:hypothetical protein